METFSVQADNSSKNVQLSELKEIAVPTLDGIRSYEEAP